ncbi:hypothetical protein OG342_30350 [Streptomyces bobili]|uniref:hypothetical protein n=1 Tax=Streptomyces bobili TaxID=67280 RepID=UPI00224DF74F|nr:hypothetical protein [Streptomyces bobili]MCX5527114.1 hypothetical protein [Streptomyces bobili]
MTRTEREAPGEMRAFLAAATGLPTILLTAALVVVACFWLLAALGLAAVGSFDTDVDLRAWHLSGVPVTVAFSLLTVLAWSSAVGTTLLVAEIAPPGPLTGLLLRPVTTGVAVLAAWATTRALVLPLHRLFPDEPVPPVPVPPVPVPRVSAPPERGVPSVSVPRVSGPRVSGPRVSGPGRPASAPATASVARAARIRVKPTDDGGAGTGPVRELPDRADEPGLADTSLAAADRGPRS